MIQEKEFKENYSQGGIEYDNNHGINPLRIANRLFPRFLIKFIKNKSKKHEEIMMKDLWMEFKKCNRVLDIGCGEGGFMEHAPKNIQIEGIDINETEVKKCLQKGLGVQKMNIEKEEDLFDNATFDGIFLSHVIEHLENPREVLNKIKKILKKSGKLVIITPNFSVFYKKFYDDPTHKKPFTKMSLFRILHEEGFNNIKIKNDILHKTNSLFSIFVFFPRLKFWLEKNLGKLHSGYVVGVCNK